MGFSSTKKQLIETWRKLRPEGTKAQCMRELGGISRPTIDKYWDGSYPSACEKVRSWVLQHPDEHNISRISRGCGVSRPTVRKYLGTAGTDDGDAFEATVDEESGQLGFGF